MNTIIIKTKQMPQLELNQVVSAYSGKPNKCMCGCSGKYNYTSVNREVGSKRRGYEVGDDEINDNGVQRILNKMTRYQELGIEVQNVDGGHCLTLEVNGRQYTVYSV